ncbi:PREDICTED: transmembrane protein 97 [Tinamus guttatus]|nr:PREDICTED: transmembrane protein 97 [Tinamus guttatus]
MKFNSCCDRGKPSKPDGAADGALRFPLRERVGVRAPRAARACSALPGVVLVQRSPCLRHAEGAVGVLHSASLSSTVCRSPQRKADLSSREGAGLPDLPRSGPGRHSLTGLLQWYAGTFRDPMMMQPPEWFKSFIFCEAFLQLPFFPIAAYAFLKGGCKWIRTPAIIYSSHVATTLLPILAHILFHDFSKSEHSGPQTQRERLILLSIYAPYLLIPLLILFTMLFSRQYNQVEKRKRK